MLGLTLIAAMISVPLRMLKTVTHRGSHAGGDRKIILRFARSLWWIAAILATAAVFALCFANNFVAVGFFLIGVFVALDSISMTYYARRDRVYPPYFVFVWGIIYTLAGMMATLLMTDPMLTLSLGALLVAVVSMRFSPTTSSIIFVVALVIWLLMLWLLGVLTASMLLAWGFCLPVLHILVRQLVAQRQDHWELAQIDDLTGLANRRGMRDYLAQMAAMQRSVGIIMIDLVDFKLVNDRYGHIVGDQVLKHVAKCLAESIRTNQDLGVRWGGDEFVVLMQETTPETLLEVQARIERLLRKPVKLDNGIEIVPQARLVTDICYDLNRSEDVMEIVDREMIQHKQG